MRPRGPEVGHRSTNGSVVLGGEGIYVSGVRDLALGRGVDTVNLRAGEVLQPGNLELLGERVDTGMLKELVSSFIHLRDAVVGLQLALAGDLLGEVVAGVEKFEEAANGIDIVASEFNLTRLRANCQ